MRKHRLFACMIIVFTLAFCLVGQAMAQELRQKLTQESTLEQVLKRGVLRVGFSTFIPWAMKDKTGKFIGFEIDVARELAKDMGVKVEFVPTKWSGIIPALLTGKFDVIIGGMGILPNRNLKVNFTTPYDYSGMSIVANKKKAEGFDSLDAFNKEGVTIAARLGTTAAQAAKKFFPKAEVRLFDDESQALQELMTGRAHAVVSSAPLPAFHALKYPKRLFLPIKGTFTKEPIGFALRKGDIDTLNFFNNWILVKKHKGWLQEHKDYWFGTKDWEKLIK
ncbi:transporter substrate-binding domain-containing protein [Dethiosulfatarculus sandiegensis]|uniref:Amino acid ABC transporter substrate-binding protein n=1 Tax=Dethiosulfatarculus sandiegensis TaxID=1429043 RepID=A0A0D2JNS2_9BACT|nr:transporter substrate-binding domain-containing protein [Dethiosulfatarculus sandiegensis]KIX11140.1 amino acid ABC transporter substrate-binding protein [Dethiosulfatarculus sandiegensis]